MLDKYTAQLYVSNNPVNCYRGNDLLELKKKSLTFLESQRHAVVGNIVDNNTGRILFKCKKTAMC